MKVLLVARAYNGNSKITDVILEGEYGIETLVMSDDNIVVIGNIDDYASLEDAHGRVIGAGYSVSKLIDISDEARIIDFFGKDISDV